MIHKANFLLSTPGISKSAAAQLLSATWWLFTELPISTHSWAQRNPDDIINGFSKCDLTGCNIFTANAFKFSICAGLGLLFGAFNGGGSSKSEEKEDDDSISVYQELVIQGLTAVKEAIDNKNMNVYLDGKLLNDFVRANSDGGGNQGATLLTAKK